MQGLLSVSTLTFLLDWMMKGLKCLVAAAMESASISHGSHVLCVPRSLALKNPDRSSLLFLVTYRVAPRPGFLTAPSVTIQSWSSGRVMLYSEKTVWHVGLS